MMWEILENSEKFQKKATIFEKFRLQLYFGAISYLQKANRWFTFRNQSRKIGVTLLIAELVENTQQQAF